MDTNPPPILSSDPAAPALESFVAEHLDLVYSAALRQMRDAHRAEDVTQAVFLIAARKIDRIPTDRAAAWLLKATRYVALMSRRTERRRRLHEHAFSAQQPTSRDPAMHDPDAINVFADEAMTSLNESDRELIVQRFFKDRSVGEIAAALGVTDNTASKRIERALARLRKLFGRRGIALSDGALGTYLLAHGILSSPPSLRGQILLASRDAASATTPAIPLKVLLMTASTKLKIAVGTAALLILVGAGVTIAPRLRAPSPPPSAPRTPVAVAPVADASKTFAKATTLTGVVRDASGKPVAGAFISQGDEPAMADGYKTTRTNANGEFVLPNVKIGAELALAAQAPGHAPELIRQGLVGPGPAPFSVTLRPGRRLQFRVLDARGNPVPNLAVDPSKWRGTGVLSIYRYRGGKWNGPLTDTGGLIALDNMPDDEVTFDPVSPKEFLRSPFKLKASDAVQTVTLRDAIKVTVVAMDDKTGEPIPEFKVVHGRGDSDPPDYWDDGRPGAGADGDYATTITWSFPYHGFRVEAPGYAPAVQSFREDKSEVTLTYRLAKAEQVALAVTAPDGKPAGEAEVYVVAPDQSFSLEQSELLHDPRFPPGSGPAASHTDSTGKVVLPASIAPSARLIVLHESGFADVAYSEVKAAVVPLQAWARVSGVARIGARPASRQKVAVGYATDHEGKPYIGGTFNATTDAEGRFAFDRVPPGRGYVGRWVETNLGLRFAQGTTTHATRITPKPGETVNVTLGGKGRAVTGRITGPAGEDLENAIYTLLTLRGSPHPRPKLPETMQSEIDAARTLPQAEAMVLFRRLQGDPAFIAYQTAMGQWIEETRDYSFVVSPDGSFRADDLEPGIYTLSVGVNSGKTMEPIGTVTRDLTIPAGAGGPSDDAIDLGKIPVQVQRAK